MKPLPGSYGSRNGLLWSRNYSATRPTPSETAAGVFGAVARITPASLRGAIDAQICPWCGVGPFKVLMSHTYQAHGVDSATFRGLAELSHRDKTCSPEASESHRRALMEHYDDTKGAAVVGKRNKTQALVDRFNKLGGTWEAMETLARSEGRTNKSIVNALRSAGAQIPDGRQVSPNKRKPGDRPPKAPTPCSTPECQRNATRRGMCEMHYRREMRQAQ
jgi:hypothetical protein